MLKLVPALDISLSISSIISFVAPYGFVVLNEISSVIGHVYGSPYTVANELNTKFLISHFFIKLSTLNLFIMLLL